MRDVREIWYDAANRASVVMADVTSAAQALVSGHLCGPASAHILCEGLAAAALLSTEATEDEEVLSIQMKCSGPLGGLNVECSRDGLLRGYTEKKILEDFDGLGAPDRRKILGTTRIQVTRSVPGAILSQGIADSLDGYLAESLQRRAKILLEASVTDGCEVMEARGILVEAMPDGDWDPAAAMANLGGRRAGLLAVSQRNILKKLGLEGAEKRDSSPLAFGCRCSRERAVAMVAALPPQDRQGLAATIAVTCHMCGKTWVVPTQDGIPEESRT